MKIERERINPSKARGQPRKIIPKFSETIKDKKGSTAVGSAMAEKYPWTAQSIAEELGMPVPSFRAWKMKLEKDGKISKPAVNSLFCIQDPEGNRLLYSDAYVNKLKDLRGNVKTRKPQEISTSALQHAKLKILVPVFDETVAKFLMKKFGSERGVQEHLKSHLIELARPAMSKIEALKKEYEEKMNELLGQA